MFFGNKNNRFCISKFRYKHKQAFRLTSVFYFIHSVETRQRKLSFWQSWTNEEMILKNLHHCHLHKHILEYTEIDLVCLGVCFTCYPYVHLANRQSSMCFDISRPSTLLGKGWCGIVLQCLNLMHFGWLFLKALFIRYIEFVKFRIDFEWMYTKNVRIGKLRIFSLGCLLLTWLQTLMLEMYNMKLYVAYNTFSPHCLKLRDCVTNSNV